MISLNWPDNGCEFNEWFLHANKFTALIAQHPGFWCFDFDLKYLDLRIDTRVNRFVLLDRDRNRIHPNRVLVAIIKQHRFYR